MKYRKVGFFGEEQANNANGIVNDVEPGLRGFVPGGALSSGGGAFYGEETVDNANGIVNALDDSLKEGLRAQMGLTPIQKHAGVRKATPLAGYSPQFPNSSMLGAAAVAPQTKIIMRPQPGAARGFPGFFAWLATEHPDMYNYAKVALPQRLMANAEGRRTGGATLQGLRGLGDDGSTATDPSTMDAGTITLASATIDPGSVPTISLPPQSGESSTDPTQTPGAVSQIVSTLSQAAATIIPTINQQQVFQAQLSRAQAGLPPLNTSAYGLTGGSISVGGAQIPVIAVLGVAAVALFAFMKK